jgi:hypothetical protein
MDAAKLLQWQYLIYLLPGGISALLLLLSSLRLGHRGGHGGHSGHGAHSGGHAAAHGSQTGGSHGGAHIRTAHAGGPKVQARLGKVEVSRHGPNRENVTVSTNLLVYIMGADRAPVAMLLEAFCLVWGLCGYWANEFTVHAAHPTLAQMLPSAGIALGGGVIGARVAAEILARVMPQDESQDVSRDGLFGLTGEIVFPVSATSGRIHIYDEHGTLHDEMCRLAYGEPVVEAIVKGRTALVVDIDPQGHLLVEEIPSSVH